MGEPEEVRELEALARNLAGGRAVRVTPMPGGASTRRFFRIFLEPGGTAVGIHVPEAAKPDEIAKVDESGRRWPFLEVRELLEVRGIRVPRLLAEACERGLVVVEDLGDDTLAAFVERRPDRRLALYRQAVRDLAAAQKALETLPADSIVARRVFDHDLLRWEIDHFREWALDARGIGLSVAERRVFDAAAEHLAATIAAWPRGFVHRDYQSRNLMVLQTEQLAWVDFQDALLGPRVYDLVALLSDSYQSFDRSFIDDRLDDYVASRGLPASERPAVGREFDLVTVQRKLKDAGRFVFIHRVKGDPSYLEFVEPTVDKVLAALERLRDDERLADLERLLLRKLR